MVSLTTIRRMGLNWGFVRAGDGNRNRMTSLEGCGSLCAELLRPRSEDVGGDRESL
jgi:hypothetical protein